MPRAKETQEGEDPRDQPGFREMKKELQEHQIGRLKETYADLLADPEYREKLQKIKQILANLKADEKFFSIDEYGPFSVKIMGGRALMRPGEIRTIPERQKSKGSLIATAALELSTNQVSHFYSEKKTTA